MVPYDKRTGKIWYNSELVDWADAKIHVLNHGLHYASCVFEGERVYDGSIFKLEEHTSRLFYSAKRMGMTIPYSEKEINDACNKIISVQNVENGYVRPTIWRGSEMMAISAQQTKIHVAIATWEWGTYFDSKLKKATAGLNSRCTGDIVRVISIRIDYCLFENIIYGTVFTNSAVDELKYDLKLIWCAHNDISSQYQCKGYYRLSIESLKLLAMKKKDRIKLFETFAALGLNESGRDVSYRWDDYEAEAKFSSEHNLIYEQAHDILLTKDIWCLHPVFAFHVLSMRVD